MPRLTIEVDLSDSEIFALAQFVEVLDHEHVDDILNVSRVGDGMEYRVVDAIRKINDNIHGIGHIS